MPAASLLAEKPAVVGMNNAEAVLEALLGVEHTSTGEQRRVLGCELLTAGCVCALCSLNVSLCSVQCAVHVCVCECECECFEWLTCAEES